MQQYYKHVGAVCCRAAALRAEEAEAVLQEVSAAVAAVKNGCTVAHKQKLQQHVQSTAESIMLQCLAEQQNGLYQHAAQSFQTLQ